MDELAENVKRVAALEDDLRRSLYFFARRQTQGVNREEAARRFGISRKLAAFHLDKLAGAGLLKFHYARPPGRTGPGAGRPAKVYCPSDEQVEVSLPERRYELMGRLLADTVQVTAEAQSGHAEKLAFEAGLALGAQAREARRLCPPGAERALAVAAEILEEHGFEPERSDCEVCLRNCPFHSLSRYAPELICAMNQSFLEGVVRGLGNDTVLVDLVPTEGQCCVRLRRP